MSSGQRLASTWMTAFGTCHCLFTKRPILSQTHGMARLSTASCLHHSYTRKKENVKKLGVKYVHMLLMICSPPITTLFSFFRHLKPEDCRLKALRFVDQTSWPKALYIVDVSQGKNRATCVLRVCLEINITAPSRYLIRAGTLFLSEHLFSLNVLYFGIYAAL